MAGDNETLRKTVIVGQRELCAARGSMKKMMGSGTIDCDATILHHHLDIDGQLTPIQHCLKGRSGLSQCALTKRDSGRA